MSEQSYKIQLTQHCEEAIQDTAYSIAFNLSAPEEAIRWVMKIRESISNLAFFPAKIQLTPEEPWHSLGIRRLPVGKYYIYFLILEELNEVRVTDVVYQGMDQAKRFTSIPTEDLI